MNLVILTNDNYFSFAVLKPFLEARREQIKLVVFSSALIGKRNTPDSIQWSLKHTGFKHTCFKLLVYGVFRLLKNICLLCPWLSNRYSSYLWVKRNGIKYIETNNINSDEVIKKIKECQPDLIISVSMNQIVKKEILRIPPKKSINVHCAPLPKYAGMSPYVWALSNNEKYSAATIHYMEEGLDEGDIIVQEKVDIVPNDSAFALFHRCCLIASKRLLEVITKFESNTVASVPQDLSQKTYFSWPTKECIRLLHENGFKLARIRDFMKAVFEDNYVIDRIEKSDPGKLWIRPMQREDVSQVTDIHRACFPASVSLFTVLSKRLAWHLYSQYVEEPESVGMVLVDPANGKIAGYAAGTLKPGFQRRFLRSHFLRIAWHVLGGLCTKPVVWKMIARALTAQDPFKAYRINPLQFEKTPPDGPVGYFMPIAIHPDYRGGGNAVRLARALMDHFFALGAVRIRGNKIAIDNTASRKLFVEKLGWRSAVMENHCVMVWADRQDTQPPAGQSAAGIQRRPEYPPVFITYGWCRSSYAVLWSLGQKALRVHVGDASPLAMSRFSRYAASFTRLPDFFIEPEKYIEVLAKALKKTGAGVLLPCHEDMGLISRYRDRLPEHIRTAVSNWETYRIVEDKLKLIEFLASFDGLAPQIYSFHSEQELDALAEDLSFPIVLKTRIGNSAKGVAIARNKNELKRKFRKLVDTYNLAEDRWPFLQEYLPGRAIGVCALYNRGKRVAWFSEEYIRCKEPGRFGTSTLRRTWRDPQTIERALTVLDVLKWHGLVHLDLIEDRQGVFKVIEINPRPWGAMALSIHAGIDFPWLWYRTALEEQILDPCMDPGRIWCRWILGDCFALIELLKKGKLVSAAKVFLPQGNCKHDDFQLCDLHPFAFQYLDYFSKFIKYMSQPRRATGGMVR